MARKFFQCFKKILRTFLVYNDAITRTGYFVLIRTYGVLLLVGVYVCVWVHHAYVRSLTGTRLRHKRKSWIRPYRGQMSAMVFFWGGGAAGIREHMSRIRGISRLVGVLTGSASSSPVTLQGVMECIDGNRAPASD